jgi:hypothetical protein
MQDGYEVVPICCKLDRLDCRRLSESGVGDVDGDGAVEFITTSGHSNRCSCPEGGGVAGNSDTAS